MTTLVPMGYPRTLVAAINMCIDKLKDRSFKARPLDERPLLAYNMIMVSSFLASHQLPIHLLAAASLIDPSHEEGLGQWMIEFEEGNLGEIVRSLGASRWRLPMIRCRIGEPIRALTQTRQWP